MPIEGSSTWSTRSVVLSQRKISGHVEVETAMLINKAKQRKEQAGVCDRENRHDKCSNIRVLILGKTRQGVWFKHLLAKSSFCLGTWYLPIIPLVLVFSIISSAQKR